MRGRHCRRNPGGRHRVWEIRRSQRQTSHSIPVGTAGTSGRRLGDAGAVQPTELHALRQIPTLLDARWEHTGSIFLWSDVQRSGKYVTGSAWFLGTFKGCTRTKHLPTMSHEILWVVSGVLLSVSLFATIANYCYAAFWYFARRRNSLIPFVGGLTGAAGWLLLPAPELRGCWWVPLMIDLGSAPLLAATIGDKLWKLWQK